MNKLRIFFWSILLLLLQILVLNNINFSHTINPYLYITFIFIFPLKKNRFILLFFTFANSTIIDNITITTKY